MMHRKDSPAAGSGPPSRISTGAMIVFFVLLFLWVFAFGAPIGLLSFSASNSLSLPGMILGVTGFAGMISLLLAIWVGFDASKRGYSGLLWGLLVFFTSIVGLVVYLLVTHSSVANGGVRRNGSEFPPPRPLSSPPSPAAGRGSAASPLPATRCGQCGRGLQSDFRVCPYCGSPRSDLCLGCHEKVEAHWKVCPHCARTLS